MKPTHELYATLENAFEFFNKRLFDGKLPPVLFTVQRKQNCMGYFSPERWGSPKGKNCHEIAINPSYVSNNALIEVLQTLAHEQTHLFQYLYGSPSRTGYHNKEWAEKMESIGLMPSTTGKPGGMKTGQHMSDYPIPGGKFITACIELMKKEKFSLPWVDRVARQASSFDIELIEMVDGLESSDQAILQTLMTNVVDLIPSAAVSTQTTPAYSKTKSKYTCQECLSNVWGKPGLKIYCEPCGVSYEEII